MSTMQIFNKPAEMAPLEKNPLLHHASRGKWQQLRERVLLHSTINVRRKEINMR
jgi:hypothetical protein